MGRHRGAPYNDDVVQRLFDAAQRMRAGDESVAKPFTELVARLLGRRLLKHRDELRRRGRELEDVVQDICLKASCKAPKEGWRDPTHLKNWLFDVMDTTITDIRRTCPAQKRLETPEDVADGTPCLGWQPGLVSDCIDSLGEKQRQALILRHFRDFDYEELSDFFQTSSGAAKQLVYRAKIELTNCLGMKAAQACHDLLSDELGTALQNYDVQAPGLCSPHASMSTAKLRKLAAAASYLPLALCAGQFRGFVTKKLKNRLEDSLKQAASVGCLPDEISRPLEGVSACLAEELLGLAQSCSGKLPRRWQRNEEPGVEEQSEVPFEALRLLSLLFLCAGVTSDCCGRLDWPLVQTVCRPGAQALSGLGEPSQHWYQECINKVAELEHSLATFPSAVDRIVGWLSPGTPRQAASCDWCLVTIVAAVANNGLTVKSPSSSVLCRCLRSVGLP